MAISGVGLGQDDGRKLPHLSRAWRLPFFKPLLSPLQGPGPAQQMPRTVAGCCRAPVTALRSSTPTSSCHPGALQYAQCQGTVRNIQRLVVHEHYRNGTERNDIALLELDQPVQCGYYVQLACVPDASLRVSELTNCYVSGWGATMARCEFPNRSTAVLQEAQVPLIDVKLCNSSRWYRGAIHPHNVCAGYPQGGIDTCQGDSGGPLVCQDKHAAYFWLVGVTSWGKGCARAKRPGVYTSTQHFYDWILAQMGLRPAGTAAPTPQPVFTSTPVQRPRPIPTQSGRFRPCQFPRQKLLEFFNLLQELLQVLRGIKA
ncbi:acrosin-like [Leptosomus discolor]